VLKWAGSTFWNPLVWLSCPCSDYGTDIIGPVVYGLPRVVQQPGSIVACWCGRLIVTNFDPGRGKAQADDEDYEESDEEPYEPGKKRKAAVKSKARYRETEGIAQRCWVK